MRLLLSYLHEPLAYSTAPLSYHFLTLEALQPIHAESYHLKIQSLVGWWPLNGNANDYSGNNNNGVPTGVIYTNNWYSGYSAP